jgi:enolase-phosphatase E1
VEFQGILLDIEGTTTPIYFVTEVLFPFARLQSHEYLNANADKKDVQEIVRALKHEHDDDVRKGLDPPKWTDDQVTGLLPVVAYINWLMDQDRKSTALKALQGKIWYDGYRTGKLRGEVFEDVPLALERWKQQRIDVRIYSSGSELSQRLLFGSTDHGDLTRFLHGYFDTNIGGKMEPDSYRKIAESFHLPPESIVFVSDVTRSTPHARPECRRGFAAGRETRCRFCTAIRRSRHLKSWGRGPINQSPIRPIPFIIRASSFASLRTPLIESALRMPHALIIRIQRLSAALASAWFAAGAVPDLSI